MFAENLEGLAPVYLVTADHDPLRDDGRAYAQRLIAAGNDVCYEEWRGTVHGFFNHGPQYAGGSSAHYAYR